MAEGGNIKNENRNQHRHQENDLKNQWKPGVGTWKHNNIDKPLARLKEKTEK